MKEFSWFTHPTGIRCVHRRTKSAVAYLSITVNAGTRDEHPLEHGVAHLTEHLLFKGTTTRTPFQISSRLESRGGDLNAYTTKEETALHATCLKTDYRRAMELLVDMLFNSKFSEKELRAEREIIVDEINSYKDSPAELIFDDFEELLFKDSALGRNILGDKRRLEKINRDAVVNYTQRNFATNQIVISSSADMSHDKFCEICHIVLEALPTTTHTPERTKPEHQKLFDINRNRHTHQTHSLIGGYAYDINAPERIPMALLANILGGPFSLSILNQTLREKKALTYNVETSYTPYTDSGVFTIYYGCEQAKADQARELIMKELSTLRNELMTGGRFDRFKRQFLGQLIISNDNQESLMLAVAKSLLVYGDFDTTEALYRKVDTISRQDIMNVANEILRPENHYQLTYN